MRTCIWSSCCHCHCHSLSLATVKSRLVLPLWYRLTRVVPEKGPLNARVRACVRARARACVLINTVSVKPKLNSHDSGFCNESVQPRQLGCQRDTARICCCTPCCGAVAAERRRCRSICPGREALRSKTAAAVVRQWDRQTGGRTDARPLHRPCSTYYAGSVSNAVRIISNNRA